MLLVCYNYSSLSCLVSRHLFSKEEIATALKDDLVTHLWDKPNKALSVRQMDALRQACSSPFFIVHGPPGMCICKYCINS